MDRVRIFAYNIWTYYSSLNIQTENIFLTINNYLSLKTNKKMYDYIKTMSNLKQINREEDKKKYPHIVLSPGTYNLLKSRGRMGDSFDKLVSDLLKQESEGGISKINDK